MLLPTYDVFDEARYFRASDREEPIDLDGHKTALTICEDAWNDKQYWERRLYSRDPVEEMAQAGADDLFLIAGDADPPLGEYASAAELLPIVAEHPQRPRTIGIAGYPEGHPLISDEELATMRTRVRPGRTALRFFDQVEWDK